MDERGLRHEVRALHVHIDLVGAENEKSCKKRDACEIQMKMRARLTGESMDFVHTVIWIRGTFSLHTQKKQSTQSEKGSKEILSDLSIFFYTLSVLIAKLLRLLSLLHIPVFKHQDSPSLHKSYLSYACTNSYSLHGFNQATAAASRAHKASISSADCRLCASLRPTAGVGSGGRPMYSRVRSEAPPVRSCCYCC